MAFRRPKAPATATASPNETLSGSSTTTSTSATTIPPSMTIIWCFWVWLTAWVPPSTV